MKRWLVRLVPLGLLAAWLLTGVKEVRPGERAVVRRFGRVHHVQDKPGLWIGLPWGIDRVDRLAVEQVRRVAVGYRPGESSADETPAGQLLTGDRNLINVRMILSWTINPDNVIAYVEQQDRAEELIARTAEAVLAEWVAGRTVDDVLLQGKTALPMDLPARLQARLDACGLGVRVRKVDVDQLAAPDDVKFAFDQVAQAQAEARTEEQRARALTESAESKAAIEVRKLDLEAETYATSRPRQARTEAREFEARLRAYQANPLVREAGRWAHLLQMTRRLLDSGQVQPLDPDLESPLRK